MPGELQICVKTFMGDFIYDGFTNQIITGDMNSPVMSAYHCYNGMYEKPQQDREYERYHCLESLTLQLTRQCNMRCTYCVYSGSFAQMHTRKDEAMDLNTIYKAIDFFEERSRARENVSISFYGGESLLEFTKIEKAVSYAEKKLSGRKIEFGISSNGLLLNEKAAYFLNAHPNIQVLITLNGEMQDVFRKTASGSGSLNIILDNIEQIRQHYPRVWRTQINFIANIISYRDALLLRDFYYQKVKKIPELITRITMDGCNSDLKQLFEYNREEEVQIEKELRKFYLETNDPFIAKLFASPLQIIHERPILNESAGTAVNPTCSPMSHRMFVRTDGSINICERVTDNVSFGSVFDGFDDDKIDAFYNEMTSFVKRNCMNCWAQHLCVLCFQSVIDETGKIAESMPEDWCVHSRECILRNLQSYIEIMLLDPKRFEIKN